MFLCQEISSVSQCNLCHTHHRRNRIFWQKSKIQSKKNPNKIQKSKSKKYHQSLSAISATSTAAGTGKSFCKSSFLKDFAKICFSLNFLSFFQFGFGILGIIILRRSPPPSLIALSPPAWTTSSLPPPPSSPSPIRCLRLQSYHLLSITIIHCLLLSIILLSVLSPTRCLRL